MYVVEGLLSRGRIQWYFGVVIAKKNSKVKRGLVREFLKNISNSTLVRFSNELAERNYRKAFPQHHGGHRDPTLYSA